MKTGEWTRVADAMPNAGQEVIVLLMLPLNAVCNARWDGVNWWQENGQSATNAALFVKAWLEMPSLPDEEADDDDEDDSDLEDGNDSDLEPK